MGVIKLSDYPKNTENPFLEGASKEIQYKQVRKRIFPENEKAGLHHIVNAESAEIEGTTAFYTKKMVDSDKFVKLYLSEITAIWELSKAAIKVFSYVLTKLVPNKDKFNFYADEAAEHCQYASKQTVYNGLAVLIEKGIVARTTHEGEFFINPAIAFNGQRFMVIKEYINKREQSEA